MRVVAPRNILESLIKCTKDERAYDCPRGTYRVHSHGDSSLGGTLFAVLVRDPFSALAMARPAPPNMYGTTGCLGL